nr:helix-turn-helix transcriptional regulator [Sedimentibacter sp.]
MMQFFSRYVDFKSYIHYNVVGIHAYISIIKVGGAMELNERIRQLRLENNLTAKKLGNIFNLSESTISLYENGKRTPSKDILLKMAYYFNVSTDYLLGKSDIPNSEFLCNLSKKNEFDVSKEIKKMLIQIEKNENVILNDKLIDYEIKIILMKSLQILIDALCLMSNDINNDTNDND